MTKIKIQLVLQGGGAKIFAIMAVLDAIQELEKNPKNSRYIHVTSVAGTSAGAIAGALFAAGVDFKTLRSSFINGDGQALVENFAMPMGKLRKLSKLLSLVGRRAPLFSQEPLRQYLDNHLRAQGIIKFSDFSGNKPKVYVVATDLTYRKPHFFLDDDQVVPALLHSAAIPFIFRTWFSKKDKQSLLLVDGGITENFPFGHGFSNHDSYRMGIAFSDTSYETPTSATGFTMSLLDAAMRASTKNSMHAIPEEDIFVLNSKVRTFEFHRLVGENGVFGVEYDAIKVQAMAWIQDFVTRKRNKLTSWDISPWEEKNGTAINLMSGLYRAYKEHEEKIKYRCHSIIFRVRAHSLNELTPSPDEFHFETTFSAQMGQISCLGLSLIDSSKLGMDRVNSTVKVFCPKNKIVPIEILPAMDEEGSKNRLLLIFLKNPIAIGSGVYKLRYKEMANSFFPKIIDKNGIPQSGIDEMLVNPSRAEGSIGEVKFILDIPKNVAHRLRLEQRQDNIGRFTTDQEIPESEMLGNQWISTGWIGENVNGKYGVNIVAS
ncbi:patatin-like phospholipase family protein [Undibacterium sp. TS12]|uniref:patatin-like phospholipase family protein n=1 Tax=Undibacterium sp. TS12 TaxID=2908202 RepID=UPI001F4CE620|nr:patatin-like phospholipase family protein [Undibacterium sp. TS12]MCH8617909.1 patatin-like phospholipase family protein [Undibacterium sp. TS12]